LEAFSLGNGTLVCHVAGYWGGVGLPGLAVGVFPRLCHAVACFCPFYYPRTAKLAGHVNSAVT
jgi:hypothetical protein